MRTWIILLLCPLLCQSQNVIHQSGQVIFFDNNKSLHDEKMKVAWWINTYLAEKHRPKDRVILEITKEDTVLTVSYDNLYGNSSFSDVYDWISWDYRLTTLKITISSFLVSKDTILNALKFGIRNKGKLRRMRKRNMRKDPTDREDSMLLSIYPS